MKTIIVSGGNIDCDFALRFLEKENYDYMIVVDKGMEFTAKAGITPNEIIGDFDSVDPQIGEFYKDQGILIRKFNPIKDSTDMEIAVETAIERGSTDIIVLGATGTRMDHVLGSIRNLSIPMKAGVNCCLIDPHNRIRMINKKTVLKKEEQYGKYVSILAHGGAVTNLTLKGFYYGLDGYTMESDQARGISNEIVEENAVISFDGGCLILIESKD